MQPVNTVRLGMPLCDRDCQVQVNGGSHGGGGGSKNEKPMVSLSAGAKS